MPLFKHDEITLLPVNMEGVSGARKANIIGPSQGWKSHMLRVFRIAPGGFTPHHQHDWKHVNYIMKGKGTLTIGDEVTEVAAGDFALVPPNTMHQFRNPYAEEFEFICIVPERGAY